MTGLDEFLRMGGYAVYVWGAYGVAAVVLIGLGVVSRRRLSQLKATLARIEGDRGRRS